MFAQILSFTVVLTSEVLTVLVLTSEGPTLLLKV